MKIARIFTLTGILFAGILLMACQHEPELIPGTTEICFDNQVLPIITSSCMMPGCHTGGGHLVALGTYEDLYKLVTPGKPMKSKLHTVITANPNSESFMPPKDKAALSSAQIDIISLWILQGANHTTCSCDTNSFAFNESIKPIFESNCAGCHSATNLSGGIALDTYDAIKACVEGDRFMGAIEQLSGYSAMPKGGKLSDCNIIQIKKWIENGNPNN